MSLKLKNRYKKLESRGWTEATSGVMRKIMRKIKKGEMKNESCKSTTR